MSAPKKIYRHQGELRTSFASDTKLDDEDVCYIRKDYLLEWAKGEQNKCSDETHPYAMFMNVVINKLNEI